MTRRPRGAGVDRRPRWLPNGRRWTEVVEHLIATDDTEMKVMSMLRVEDAQSIIVDEAALSETDPDLLAGPFAHVVVDEAQELTDAEWQMLLGRCPSRSLTIVGDRAQARHGFTESWEERLERIGLDHVNLASLSINYRTPEEVMAEAEPVIRAVLPGRQRADLRSAAPAYPSSTDPRRELDAILDDVAGRARRRHRLRDRRPDVRGDRSGPLPEPGARRRGSSSTWSCSSTPRRSARASREPSTATSR